MRVPRTLTHYGLSASRGSGFARRIGVMRGTAAAGHARYRRRLGSRLVALEPYQPLFVAAAYGFFGFAFHHLYRTTACTPGGACAIPAALLPRAPFSGPLRSPQ